MPDSLITRPQSAVSSAKNFAARSPDQVKSLEAVTFLQTIQRSHCDTGFEQCTPLMRVVPGRPESAQSSHAGIGSAEDPGPGVGLALHAAGGSSRGRSSEHAGGLIVIAKVALKEHLRCLLVAARRGQPIPHTKVAACGVHPQRHCDALALRLIE